MEGIEKFRDAFLSVVESDDLPEETPGRVFRAMKELTQGYEMDPLEPLRKRFPAPSQNLICVRDIPFASVCEHHILPFVGHVHIGYIPGKEITGLSKFGRVVDILSQRLQVQERFTKQVADAIESLDPIGIAVVVRAEHTCMGLRGVRKHGAETITSEMRGVFFEKSDARQEVLRLLT